MISPGFVYCEYFMVKNAVSLGLWVMTSSYQLRCGVLFVLVNMIVLKQPENTYLEQRLVHCLFKIIIEV